MKIKNILITGGTGFIGAHVVKRLHKDGHNLTLLVRETSDISQFEDLKNIKYVIGDIRDILSIRKAADSVDLIYHLAAYVGIWAKKYSTYEEINVNGTENVVKVTLELNKKLIYMSSFTAIGPSPENCEEPVDESYENSDNLCMDYEKSKFAAKKLVKEYIKKGLKATLIYPGIVFGPGDFNIFGQMLYDIVRGKFLGCPGKGDSVAVFTYIKDLAEVMANIAERDDIYGENYIIGGVSIKFGEYLDTIAEVADVKKPRHLPMSGAMFYGWLCETKAKITNKVPYITRANLNGLKFNREYSSKKAIDKLGYKITPLREALQETVKWYQDYIENEKKKN
ncbi:MAG: NAD-dependent epimerase/dehydratase family protein [Promethearchaeota archaeon]